MKRVFDFYPRLRIDYEISFKSYNITIKCFTQINRSDYIPNKKIPLSLSQQSELKNGYIFPTTFILLDK